MKLYYEGRYWDEKISDRDKEYLFKVKPQFYFRLFPKPIPKTTRPDQDNHIYQIYYDEYSRNALDSGFIPYDNGFTHNFENDVILDVWRSRTWINAKYVGLLSWRFYEKTGLTSESIKLEGDVNYFAPKGYKKYHHPFSRKGFGSVNELIRIADDNNLFDFKLLNHPIDTIVWCNYWAVKPKVFDHYCTCYLSKVIEFFKDRPEYNLMEMHRGKQYPAMTFFLEGLFSIFLQHNGNYKVKIH